MEKSKKEKKKERIAQRNAYHYCKSHHIIDADKKVKVLEAMRLATRS